MVVPPANVYGTSKPNAAPEGWHVTHWNMLRCFSWVPVSAQFWPELSAVQRLAYDACHALERVLAPKRLYVAAFGSDSAAPMTFAHYHLHVVPIQEEGESARPAEVFSWSRGVVTYDAAEAARLVAELRRAFPKIEPA